MFTLNNNREKRTDCRPICWFAGRWYKDNIDHSMLRHGKAPTFRNDRGGRDFPPLILPFLPFALPPRAFPPSPPVPLPPLIPVTPSSSVPSPPLLSLCLFIRLSLLLVHYPLKLARGLGECRNGKPLPARVSGGARPPNVFGAFSG